MFAVNKLLLDMKRILLVLLFISGICTAADFRIVTPTPYTVCDDNSDGIVDFYLETKTAEILGGANPSNYIVTYHETFSTASDGVFLLGPVYTNITGSNQTLFVRVEEIGSGTFEIVQLQLVVIVGPYFNNPQNLIVFQNNASGMATFDLTSQNGNITGGMPSSSITYHLSESDANLGLPEIVSANSFVNTSNPQVIWVRVANGSGCPKIGNFSLSVQQGTQDDIVYIPDANFKAKLLNATSSNFTASNNLNQYVKVDLNNDGEIQYSEALNIKGLSVGNSGILNLTGIEAFYNLKNLRCSNNNLTTLNLSSLISLESLNCQNSQLVSLNIQNLANLRTLACDTNNLTSLDLTVSNKWEYLSCTSNQIAHLDMSTFINYIPSNSEIWLNNNLLTTLIVKNGLIDNGYFQFENNPTLRFICADDSEIAHFQGRISEYGYTNCVVNSYCTFEPGGNYNTIKGKTTFDSNNNGCDASDLAQSFLKVKINDGTNQGATFTNTAGDYNFYTQAGNFTVTPEVENPTFFNISPATATVNFPLVNNSISTNNFCITANGNHPDAEIVIAPVTPARPGFDAVYKIVYKNRGNQTLSGNVYFYYNETLLDYVTSTAVPTQSNGLLTFAFSNLMPFESRSISVTLNVNGPTENPAVNIGDELIFNGATDPIAGNEITFSYIQTVVGAYDPNDITCLEGDVVPPSEIGEYLHYMIRFENTGNFAAENIVVKDILDPAKYDISSLQILDSSHPVNADVKGNIAEFVFRNINLDSGGHGNILIKLRSLSSLGSGSTVSNGVGIYFDYNFPVNTENANTVFQALSIGEKHLDSSVKIYPNPANDFVNIKASSNINSIEMYDVQGRILMTGLYNEASATLDLSRQSSGIYYLKIKTEEGSKVEKVIKK